jgi:CDP-diacylglycerol--glycerol-3-phosphate 3-phosphatidyltransferase
MITIYDLKPKFQALLRPLVGWLVDRGYTPNQITWLALIISSLTGCLVAVTQGAVWTLVLVPVVLFVRMALNAIDGMMAKEHDMKSDGGAMLNEIGDILSDVLLYLPFAFIAGVSPLWVVLFVITALFTEFAGVLSWAVMQDRRYDGPMGKSDRAFVMGAVSLLMAWDMISSSWLDILFIVMTLLSIWTMSNRTLKALR